MVANQNHLNEHVRECIAYNSKKFNIWSLPQWENPNAVCECVFALYL